MKNTKTIIIIIAFITAMTVPFALAFVKAPKQAAGTMPVPTEEFVEIDNSEILKDLEALGIALEELHENLKKLETK